MKNVYLFLFLFSSVSIFSQNILKGKISDKDNIPLEGVNIYFDGTTFSTVTDVHGNYVLNYDSNVINVLVISAIGYKTEYFAHVNLSRPLNVNMVTPKNELKEVVVNANELFTRSQKIKLFREYFLGKTNNAKLTVISNEDDIRFKYDKKKLVFTAFSDKPLIIINPSLGYRINFELIVFEIDFNKLSIYSKDAKRYFFKGVSRFEEIENSSEILERREKAYQGSQIQFFRNFANNDWDSAKFLLYNGEGVIDPDSRFKITKKDDFVNVEVLRRPKAEISNEDLKDNIVAAYNIEFNRREESKITFQTNSFDIYKYGTNSNIEGVLFSGKISEKRVGDMLPLNYGIE